jgi:hypothetical protein
MYIICAASDQAYHPGCLFALLFSACTLEGRFNTSVHHGVRAGGATARGIAACHGGYDWRLTLLEERCCLQPVDSWHGLCCAVHLAVVQTQLLTQLWGFAVER